MTTQQDVDQFIDWMQFHLPTLNIKFKNESAFQILLGKILWPINKTYMTQYTTVMFGQIYFPSRSIIHEWGPERVYKILRHEFVHLIDAKRFPIWFELSYLFLFPIGLTMRAYWEYRGYCQNLLVEFEQQQTFNEETINAIILRFTNNEYGWMLPFPKLVHRILIQTCEKIKSGRLKGPYPYKVLKRKSIHKN